MNPSQTARVRVGEDDDGPIDVFAEVFGALTPDPPVILLSAAEESAMRWPTDLIDGLRASCGAVIRFDTRGIGRNRSIRAGYELDDLAGDAVAVLDEFGVDAAHLVGRSMGGMIGQLVALDHAHRAASLTLVSTSAGPDPRIGGPEQWFVDVMSRRLFEGAPPTNVERVAWLVEQQEWFAGPRCEFDRAAAEQAAVELVSDYWHDEVGHGLAVVNAEPRYDRLGEISAETLVIHGTADPVYPVGHGQALADAIPNAEILLVEGLGHEFPPDFVAQFLDRYRVFIDR